MERGLRGQCGSKRRLKPRRPPPGLKAMTGPARQTARLARPVTRLAMVPKLASTRVQGEEELTGPWPK